MQKLVIGCGYLGHRVANAWIRQGHTVTVLTRNPEHAARFRSEGLIPVVGDVTDAGTLNSLPPAETVLFAVGYDRAASHTQRDVYVDGLENVLRLLAGHVRRFLSISSTSVYGQSSGEWVDESSPCEPTRPNGIVCLDAEQRVCSHFPPEQSTAERGANVLRLAGFYGPNPLLQRGDALKSGRPLSGNPDAYLNLIHVDDAVKAVLACEERGRSGSTYLVCDDQPIPRREYYERLALLVDAPSPQYEETVSEANESLSLNKRCSNRKLHEELGVELSYPTVVTGLPHALSGST